MNFNIIVIGESGTGKTTFIKCFLNKMQKQCNSNNSSTNENSHSFFVNNNFNEKRSLTFNMIEDVIFEKDEDEASLEKKINNSSTLSFTAHTVKHISSKKYNQITLIDSPGYGHSLNNKKWLKEIIEYIKKRVYIPFTLRIIPTITLKTRLI